MRREREGMREEVRGVGGGKNEGRREERKTREKGGGKTGR